MTASRSTSRSISWPLWSHQIRRLQAASARLAAGSPGTGRLHPCPTRPIPCAPPRCKPARSSFFRAGVRILDFDLATLALADGHAGLAPRPVALPGDACIVQHRPDVYVLTL